MASRVQADDGIEVAQATKHAFWKPAFISLVTHNSFPNVPRQRPWNAGTADAREAERASAVTACRGSLDESVRIFGFTGRASV